MSLKQDNAHKNLAENLWEKENTYYDLAEESSKSISSNPGLEIIQETCRQSSYLLDCGCGEGQKLDLMKSENGFAFGVDISSLSNILFTVTIYFNSAIQINYGSNISRFYS